jgi:hypothetical protein
MLKSLLREKKQKLFSLKVSIEELAAMQKNANLFTNGNMSAWVRYASTYLKPNPKDIEIEEDVGSNKSSV